MLFGIINSEISEKIKINIICVLPYVKRNIISHYIDICKISVSNCILIVNSLANFKLIVL